MALFHMTVLDNQIKALPTVDTASGSIATFDTDLTENLVEVKCQIVAQQASGTPSPDNPLPITTYTEMNVFATGKNLSEVSDIFKFGAQSCTYIYENNGVNITATNAFARIGFSYKVKTGQKYTISYYAYGTGDYISVYYNDANAWQYSYGTQTTTATRTKYTQTITATSDTLFVGFYATANATSGDMIIEDFMVELGEEATSFVAYNGTTSNIPFGQTVANGVLDITTGKLRVTHRYVKPATDFELQNGVFTSRYDVSGIKQAETTSSTNLIIKNCNMFNSIGVKYRSEVTDGTIAKVVGANNQIACFSTAYTDVADFNTRVIQQGLLEIVYEYATPIEIQLDSITLQALLNENNIWCDTGDTEVKYLLTVGKKIS